MIKKHQPIKKGVFIDHKDKPTGRWVVSYFDEERTLPAEYITSAGTIFEAWVTHFDDAITASAHHISIGKYKTFGLARQAIDDWENRRQ